MKQRDPEPARLHLIAELRPFQGAGRTVYFRATKCHSQANSMAARKGAGRAGKAVPDRADDFAKAFYGLKMVFAKYERYLHVNADTREKYYLETKSPSYNGKPLFFGAVIRGRAYVSFHLMPLYWDASLAKGISASLKGRMQGKSCFNFLAPDAGLFRELGKLTARGFALYKRKNLL
jgi:hypothetical protein